MIKNIMNLILLLIILFAVDVYAKDVKNLGIFLGDGIYTEMSYKEVKGVLLEKKVKLKKDRRRSNSELIFYYRADDNNILYIFDRSTKVVMYRLVWVEMKKDRDMEIEKLKVDIAKTYGEFYAVKGDSIYYRKGDEGCIIIAYKMGVHLWLGSISLVNAFAEQSPNYPKMPE